MGKSERHGSGYACSGTRAAYPAPLSNKMHQKGSTRNLRGRLSFRSTWGGPFINACLRSPGDDGLCKQCKAVQALQLLVVPRTNHARIRRGSPPQMPDTGSCSGCGHDLIRRLNQWLVRETPCQAIHGGHVVVVGTGREEGG